jgi:hypothetical protein
MTMKASANKSSKPGGRTVTRSDRPSFFGRARDAGFFAPVRRPAAQPFVQAKLKVSTPNDPLEKEADRTAEHVMRMATPGSEPQREEATTRKLDTAEKIQRVGDGAPAMTADAHSKIRQASGGGQPLPSDVRSFMEPRFGADFGDVRVHTDASAHGVSSQLSARAFTHRNDIFFGRDQYKPDSSEGRQLLAHELTHTIQQGTTVQRASQTQSPPVSSSASPPAVQRLGIQDALDYFADKAYYIPGFRMLTLVLGFNPINMRKTDRTAANFLRALVELVPGGRLVTQVLDNHGVINKAAEWVEQKVAALGDIGGQIVDGLKRFISSLSWTDIFDLGGVWDRAKRIFTDPIDRLIAFGTGVVSELLDLVKQAILRPLAALAEGTRGYDLLKAILGQDPITGDPVPRTAETLIGGFMKLIGQEEVWQNLKRGNAIGRAWAWFQQALSGLMAFVLSIPRRIVQTLRSLTFQDVITVVGAFQKIGAAFLGLVSEFAGWAGKQVLALLEILFSVVAPRVMPYIAKAKAAFHTILENPVRFVGNLVRAGRLGFEKFAANILEHLKAALIKWITGPLGEAGVYIPTSFSLLEIVKLVLSVLGLTWQNIRTKLLKIIPEPVLTALEKTAAILVTLVTQGPAAAWEQIKAELTELKDQLVGKVTEMIQMEVVKAAVKKLVSMLNPAGAVIQAIIAIYNTVTFFIEKIQQIGAVVATFIDSISAIASGAIEGAAKKVEQTMANTLTLVIGFLAKFAGLGSIPEKLVGIVKKIRQPIDKALDKIVDWLGKMLQKLLTFAKETAKKFLEWWKKKVPVTGGDEPHTLTFVGERESANLVVRSVQPEKPSEFLKREHERAGADAKLLTTPKKQAEESEKRVFVLQKALGKIDDNERVAASGTRKEDANAKSNKLDDELEKLAGIISKALAAWGADGDMPQKFDIERAGGFTVRQKTNIAGEYEKLKERLAHLPYGKTNYIVKDSKGRDINLDPACKVDRRHVVSSHDMATHYEVALANKKLSEAKLLLEQRGSIADARKYGRVEPTKKLTAKLVIAAAKRRYKEFFGYAKNIFIGDSSENRSIQEYLDTGYPGMAGRKLREHVQRIKRGWALDSNFEPTEDPE